jgi:hypothetical protein
MNEMNMLAQEKPMYDEKVNEILRGLTIGKTREELAEEAGNSSWKSIDMYMRRHNFTWDSHKKNYVPKQEPIKQEVTADSSKAGHVISLLSKEGADVRSVAERIGFKNHRELAHYMNVKGYVWDSDINNYIKQVGEITQKVEDHDTGNAEKESPSHTSNVKGLSKGNVELDSLERFLPLLEMLDKHRERLLDFIVPTSQTGVIPRFVVPGVAKTKTVHMMNTLEQLVVDFSREKNISQRELFEVALLEFFKKYGYEQEVERLLSC